MVLNDIMFKIQLQWTELWGGGERPTKRLGATDVVPMRVAEEERVESGEGLGRKVLATESTDSTEGHL